jgi:hypothetical protein
MSHFTQVIHRIKSGKKYYIGEKDHNGEFKEMGPMKLVGLEYYQDHVGYIYDKDGKYFVRDCPERDLGIEVIKNET